jgi:hypothetical protein
LALMNVLTERDLAWRRDMTIWRVVYWLLTGALIGFGALAAAILIWDVTSMPWACQMSGNLPLPNVNYFSCVDTPFGLFTSYHVMAFFFGLITLLGLVWPLAQRLWTRSRSQTA